MNSVNIIGRITKAPKLTKTQNDNYVLQFTLAYNPGGQGNKTSSFFKVFIFGNYAKVISEYMYPGQKVAVTGALRQSIYVKEDNTKVSTVDIKANSISLLEKPKEEVSLERKRDIGRETFENQGEQEEVDSLFDYEEAKVDPLENNKIDDFIVL